MDFTAKRALVESISDEVGILHPLLNHTLRNLDGVQQVDYTHGPNERGADFIVTRIDQSLNVHGYVGVIVKVGKILSNFDDVARQIEECRLPRPLPGGTTLVRLSEVWIVTNSTISRNAQDKIQDKYAAQKTIFINGDKLTELVDQHAEYFWYNVPSEVGSYLQQLSKRLQSLDSELSVLQGLDCGNFYVEPDIQEFTKTAYVKKSRPTRPRLVNFVDDVLKSKVSVLEGDMGYGKSKTARHITNYYCAPERFKQTKVLPIFVTFRQIGEKKLSLAEHVASAVPAPIRSDEKGGITYLFVIDGVDEAIGKVTDWQPYVQSLIREANSSSIYRLLLTSRPLKLLDEQVSLFAGATRYQIRPLSIGKLVSFLERACSNLSLPRRLFEDLQRSELFRQLPHSPIAAALLSRLIAQNSSDLPSNLTELYAKSIELMLGRWDIARGGCTEKEYRDAERVAIDLADYIVGNSLGTISISEAKQRIANWHQKRNTNTSLDALQDRVLEKSSLFLCDENLGLVAFRHRSFGEFMYARSRQQKNLPLTPKQSFSPEYIYIQFFYTGLQGDCEDHLFSLLSYTPETEAEAWLKVMMLPDYLLAGYQTPYDMTEGNLYKLFIEASRLFLKIRDGDTKTKLSDLPVMHLLWFFQRIIRGAFEYEFFRRAISSTLLRIDGELIDTEEKQYALFFAACFAAELGDGSGFEFLLKSFDTAKLPLPISLAVRIEREMNKDFAKLPRLKEHEKRLNELLGTAQRGNRVETLGRRKSIDDLFERPARSLAAPNTAEATSGAK